MIRINLLAAERESKKKKATFQSGQKVTIACSLVLVLTGFVIGWRYLAIARESSKLDDDIAKAQTVIAKRKRFWKKVATRLARHSSHSRY